MALLNPTYSWPAIFFTNSITLTKKDKIVRVLQHISDHSDDHIHGVNRDEEHYLHSQTSLPYLNEAENKAKFKSAHSTIRWL